MPNGEYEAFVKWAKETYGEKVAIPPDDAALRSSAFYRQWELYGKPYTREKFLPSEEQQIERLAPLMYQDVIPWQAVKATIGAAYPEEGFWEWLEESQKEGYGYPAIMSTMRLGKGAAAGIRGASKARWLLQDIQRMYEQYEEVLAPPEKPIEGFEPRPAIYPAETDFVNRLMREMENRATRLAGVATELTPEQTQQIRDFALSLAEAQAEAGFKGSLEEYQQAAEAGDVAPIDIDVDESIGDIIDEQNFEQAYRDKYGTPWPGEQLRLYEEAGIPYTGLPSLPPVWGDMARQVITTSAGSLPPLVMEQAIDDMSRMLEERARTYEQQTGRTISGEELIEQMSGEELVEIAEQAMYRSLPGELYRRAHEVGQQFGMTEVQFAQRGFEQWRQGLAPEYQAQRTEGELWTEYMTQQYMGDIEMGEQAPPPQEGPMGGAEPYSQQQARGLYQGKISGYSPQQQRYLQGFFPSLWSGFGGGIHPNWERYGSMAPPGQGWQNWENYLTSMNIEGLLPEEPEAPQERLARPQTRYRVRR